MKRALEAMPDFMPERAMHFCVIRSNRLARVDAADRADEAVAAIDREEFLSLLQRRIADRLNLLVWNLLPVDVDLCVDHTG